METTKEQFERLNREDWPCAYYGDKGDWCPVYSVTRDSHIPERADFEAFEKLLKDMSPDDYDIERAGHWACGWVDTLVINPANERMKEAVKEVLDALSEYPRT